MSVDLVNKRIGISVTADMMAKLLTKMGLQSFVNSDGKNLTVSIPPTRAGTQ